MHTNLINRKCSDTSHTHRVLSDTEPWKILYPRNAVEADMRRAEPVSAVWTHAPRYFTACDFTAQYWSN